MDHNCHIALYEGGSCAAWFKELRDGLTLAGLDNVPPMTIRLHVVVEKGAIRDGLPGSLHVQESRLEYDRGPFHEADQPIVSRLSPDPFLGD
jgi:hypothetical protein